MGCDKMRELNSDGREARSTMAVKMTDVNGQIEGLEHIDGVTVSAGEPLAKHVSMGVGGPARWFITVETVEALEAVLARLRGGAVPWMMLGGGSNTIFTEAGFGGAIVTLGRGFRQIAAGPGEHEVTAGAGANLSALMNYAKRRGLTGMEWAAGVPGTVGGALAGNAGTGLGEMCDRVAAVEVIDAAGARRMRRRGEFSYGYRRSDLARDVILRATVALAPDDVEAIQARIDQGLKKRFEQPVGKRCSGCMFKNPAGDYAGRLIDRAGLKGLRVGGAQVSEEHANFIINEGEATSEDIRALVEEVRRRVREATGVELELEIRMVGLDSRLVLH